MLNINNTRRYKVRRGAKQKSSKISTFVSSEISFSSIQKRSNKTNNELTNSEKNQITFKISDAFKI